MDIPESLQRKVEDIFFRYPPEHREAALVPLMFEAQRELGCISPDTERWIADVVGVSLVKVREVLTFYSMFRTEPAGKYLLQLCQNISCCLVGAEDLQQHLEKKLGIRNGETTRDGMFTLKYVECLGGCSWAPMMLINENQYCQLTIGKLDYILDGLKSGHPMEPDEPTPLLETWPSDWIHDGPRDEQNQRRDADMSFTGEERLLSRNFPMPGQRLIDRAMKRGAYDQLRKALSMKPEEVVAIVKASGLRGHGGAGFSAGMKWSFVPADKFPRYVCVNADESEPGTCKDRLVMESDPHLLLEGALICAFAVQAERIYIYIRGEYYYPTRVMQRAVDEARARGLIGENILNSGWSCSCHLACGAGQYICGEETGLIESLEGKKGWPRLKPPFYPAAVGLWGKPTIVNNVETLAFVPRILEIGPEKFAALGSPKNGGTALFSLSGNVRRPGVYELRMGTPLRTLIYECGGGITADRQLKGVIPGGSSSHILTAAECRDLKLDFEAVAAAGSMLGSAAVMVIDETVPIPRLMLWMTRFYAHESCGQCTPCREGTAWLLRLATRIVEGKGRKRDLDDLYELADNIDGKTICAFGSAVAWPTKSYLAKFRHEFEALVKE